MTTAAESPGAEVRQEKKRHRRWLWTLPLSGFIGTALAFISVFVGMGIYAVTAVLEDVELGKAKADIRVLEINLVRYKTMTNKLPDSLEDFVLRPESLAGKWQPLMQKSALRDVWGEPYQYRNPGIKNPKGYDLFSKGPDKTEGTDDDIGNWQ